jgi:hypothetical protein
VEQDAKKEIQNVNLLMKYKGNVLTGIETSSQGQIMSIKAEDFYNKTIVMDWSKLEEYYKKMGIVATTAPKKMITSQDLQKVQQFKEGELDILIEKIAKSIYNNLQDKNIVKSNAPFLAGTGTVDAQKFEIKFNEDEWKVFLKAIIEEVSADAEVKKIVVKKAFDYYKVFDEAGYFEASGDSGLTEEDIAKKYDEKVKELKDACENIKLPKGVTYEVYVVNGKIAGRRIITTTLYESHTIDVTMDWKAYKDQDNKNFEELFVKATDGKDPVTFSVMNSYKEEGEKTIKGDLVSTFEYPYNGKSVTNTLNASYQRSQENTTIDYKLDAFEMKFDGKVELEEWDKNQEKNYGFKTSIGVHAVSDSMGVDVKGTLHLKNDVFYDVEVSPMDVPKDQKVDLLAASNEEMYQMVMDISKNVDTFTKDKLVSIIPGLDQLLNATMQGTPEDGMNGFDATDFGENDFTLDGEGLEDLKIEDFDLKNLELE